VPIWQTQGDVTSTSGNIAFQLENADGSLIRLGNLNATGLLLGENSSPSSNLQVQGNAVVSEKLAIGGELGSSNLSLSGTFSQSLETISLAENYTNPLAHSAILANTASANSDIFLSLPSASNIEGRTYSIKKTSSDHYVFVEPQNGETIDGYPYLTMDNTIGQLPYVNLVAASSNWHVLDTNIKISHQASDNLRYGLVGYWKLDEDSSATQALDSSSYGNHGSYFNLPSANIGVTGKVGKAVWLTESTAIKITAPESLVFNNDKLTVMCWFTLDVLPTSQGNANVMFMRNPHFRTGFSVINDKMYTIQLDQVGITNLNDGGRLSAGNLNQWNHFAVVYDGGYIRGYINGRETGKNVSTGTITGMTAADFYIGRPVNFTYHDGYMDEVRIYNRALSADDILYYYDSTK
jgi:hypothetical protein